MRKQAKWILLIVIVVISARVLSAQTNVSGEVSGIWEFANSPYIIVGDISIVGDSLLVIEAGVEVRFDGFYQFVAYGILSAVGTESEPILFTSNATTPNPGDWYNIDLFDLSIMQYCIVEYAGQPEPPTNKFAIRLSGNCEVLNNVIRYNNVSGIGAMFESSVIRGNLIYDNSSAFFAGAGIYSQWSSAKILNNTIAENNFAGLLLQANSDSLTVINNIIVNNSGVGFQYDQITGSPFPIADYNDVWENTPNYLNLTPGAHSISEDPLFVGGDDYHLTADSPCIDAGDPAFPLDPDGTIADMGAYPFYQDFEIDITALSYANFTGGVWLTEDQIIDEGDSLNFFIVASDPNGNDLEYEWLLDGEEVSIESTYSFLTNEFSAGEYEVTLFVTDNAGSRNELNYLWNITVNDVVSVEDEILFTPYSLQNFPNPFNPSTTISFTAEGAENAEIEIYNLKGQKIKQYSIFNNQSSTTWNGTDENNQAVSSGVYFYRLNINGKTEAVKKCLLVK
ncbi:MAG: right-handed parallel beta-helix repeat-containing protein [Candidatus Cloacimonetes bacterium]|nr:right-handed parallel beta-helix repeat-containing protein [Bacteroidota bacterium]MBL7149271.1 right-handed parallel beta-helix repeat-containing protein [Candidatus Cloacimonadota bacterium]